MMFVTLLRYRKTGAGLSLVVSDSVCSFCISHFEVKIGGAQQAGGVTLQDKHSTSFMSD